MHLGQIGIQPQFLAEPIGIQPQFLAPSIVGAPAPPVPPEPKATDYTWWYVGGALVAIGTGYYFLTR